MESRKSIKELKIWLSCDCFNAKENLDHARHMVIDNRQFLTINQIADAISISCERELRVLCTTKGYNEGLS